VNDRNAQTITACRRDERRRLIIRDAQGREYKDVRPFRMFPLTDPEGWISICDLRGNELMCVESVKDVPAECRRILEEELNRCMFTPVIQRITKAKHVGEQVRLFLETDRGAVEILVDPEDIYRLSGNRALIRDVNGVRYLIPDLRRMGSYCRKILDEYL
jgi:hypothetical protein